MFRKLCFVILAATACSTTLLAQNQPFLGIWKLNAEKTTIIPSKIR